MKGIIKKAILVLTVAGALMAAIFFWLTSRPVTIAGFGIAAELATGS